MTEAVAMTQERICHMYCEVSGFDFYHGERGALTRSRMKYRRRWVSVLPVIQLSVSTVLGPSVIRRHADTGGNEPDI